MSRPSNVRVLWLFARTALRRAANASMLFAERARQNLGKKKNAPPTRTATLPRGQRGSRGGRMFAASFAMMCILGAAMLLSRSIPCVTQAVRLDAMARAEIVSLDKSDFEALQAAARLPDKTQAEAGVNKALSSAVEGYGSDWLEKRGASILQEKFRTRGLAGFRIAEPTSDWRGNLAFLSDVDRLRALRGAGLYLLLVGASGICLTIGLMSRNLSQNDPALVWLLQFPVSRRTLFLSKLGEYTVGNSNGPLAALLAAMLVWGFGARFSTGLAFALCFGMATAVSAGAIRLVLEMFLTQRCRRKTRGALVSVAAAVGSIGLMFAGYFANAAPTTQMFLWASDRLPDFVFWNPLSLGFGTAWMARGIGPIWWFGPAVTALGLGAFAIVWATRLTARGLATAGDSVAAAARSVPLAGALKGMLPGLVWKELLQLRRQPEFLFQVLSAPIVVGFLLYIRNPDQFLRVATGDVSALCISVFAASAYLLVVAAAAVLRTELRTLWFLQCQPRSLADCLRTKARIWAGLSIAIGLSLLVVLAAFQPGHRIEIVPRALFLIAYLWLLAEISFGFLALGATVVNEETVRFRRFQWVTPMLISGQCAAMLYRGVFWEELTLLAVLFVLSIAVRQKQLSDLAWLSEPIENPPVRFDVLNALLVVLAFLFLRDFCGGFLAHAHLSLPMGITIAYVSSAFVVWGVTSIWMARTGRRIAPIQPSCSPLRPVLLGLAATCSTGLLWVGVLRHSSEAAMAQTSLRLPSTLGAGDADKWMFLATVVLAAPLFEEWLFRGLLYRSLRRSWGIAASVAISALLFTAIHPMSSCVGVLCLAITTALVLERTGRLWPSMLIHFGYNAFIVALWNVP